MSEELERLIKHLRGKTQEASEKIGGFARRFKTDECLCADYLEELRRQLAERNALIAAKDEALEELLNYKGGADSALDDDDVIYRAVQALTATPAEAVERKQDKVSGKNQRGEKVNVECLNCGCSFSARVADRNRGWGRFCSKSCKAEHQEKRTHQYAKYCSQKNVECDDVDCGHIMQSGVFGHGQD